MVPGPWMMYFQIWEGHDLTSRTKRSGSRICTRQKSHRGGALQGAWGSKFPCFFVVSFCQVNNMFTSICPSCPTECKLDLISDSCDQRYNAAMQQSHIQNSNVAQPSSVRCGLKRDKKSTNKQFRCCLGSLGTMGTLVETRPLWSSLPQPSSKPNRCPNRQWSAYFQKSKTHFESVLNPGTASDVQE